MIVRPEWAHGHLVLQSRGSHVVLHFLWLGYRQRHHESHTQSCHYCNEARRELSLTLRQEHKAGEKLFTDYAGDTLPLIGLRTGEARPVYVLVVVPGASRAHLR